MQTGVGGISSGTITVSTKQPKEHLHDVVSDIYQRLIQLRNQVDDILMHTRGQSLEECAGAVGTTNHSLREKLGMVRGVVSNLEYSVGHMQEEVGAARETEDEKPRAQRG